TGAPSSSSSMGSATVVLAAPVSAEAVVEEDPAATPQLQPFSTDAGPISAPWAELSSAAPVHARPTAHPALTWRGVIALLVLGALGLSCWALMNGAERHVLSGTVQLSDSSMSSLNPGDECSGSGGYGDISAGAGVVLTDGSGTTMATTVLSDGVFDGTGCVFSFVLHEVHHASFYRLAVAGSNRGQLQYSYADLARGDWSVQLSVGDA
ncbi:MAG: hypothetical protein ACXVHC_00320, partial [Frankiaceae bacterium]